MTDSTRGDEGPGGGQGQGGLPSGLAEGLELLHADHAQFARLLRALERALAEVHEAGPADFDLLRDAMDYLLHYPDLVHHRVEDLLFERLAARDGSLRPLMERLSLEHRTLHRLGRTFADVLERVIDGALVDRQELEEAGRQYIEALRHHMGWEEGTVFPRVRELLSPADWEAVRGAVAEAQDPLFGPVRRSEYEALRAWLEHPNDGSGSGAGQGRGH